MTSIKLIGEIEIAPSFTMERCNLDPDELFVESIKHAPTQGLFLEFGVAQGRTLRIIRQLMNQRSISETLYGFDSFNGLPDDWKTADNHIILPRGYFRCTPPKFDDEKIILIEGMFQDTLEQFLQEHQGIVAFAHIDCDLYSSTAFVLDKLQNIIAEGTVIQFDEIHGRPGFDIHEQKAFCEFLERTKWNYQVIGKTASNVAAFKMTHFTSP